MLSIETTLGKSVFDVNLDIDLKTSDGPDCLCQLKEFKKENFCKMEPGDIVGSFDITVDVFISQLELKLKWDTDGKMKTKSNFHLLA